MRALVGAATAVLVVVHGVRLAGDDHQVDDILGDAGPDAADVSFEELQRRIELNAPPVEVCQSAST